jgi:arginine repressor
MKTKIDLSVSKKTKNEILAILFKEKEKTSGKILKILSKKEICYSRTTLSKYLSQLHQQKLIEYRTNPQNKTERLYRINDKEFNQTPLYPRIMAAMMAKTVKEEWSEQTSLILENFKKFSEAKNAEDIWKLTAALDADLMESAKDSIVNLEKTIGHIVVSSLSFQSETEIKILENITYFIQFLYLNFIKKDETLKQIYEENGSFESIRNYLSMDYNNIQKELMLMDFDICGTLFYND